LPRGEGTAPLHQFANGLPVEILRTALKTGIDIAQARWLLFAQNGASIPSPLLVVLIFWLTILFASFSLVPPPQPNMRLQDAIGDVAGKASSHALSWAEWVSIGPNA
jgi:hypothetical protein